MVEKRRITKTEYLKLSDENKRKFKEMHFDEQFEVGCYEDDDYCKRVTNAGGHIVVDTRVKLKHLLSQTFGLFDQSKYMVENGKRFKEKHNL